jgi:type IV secretion system protein VirB6
MTMLIVTVPTIAAALWQGNMGTFMAYSAFGAAASPGPQGQPAGSYMPQQVARNSNQASEREFGAAPNQSTRSIGSTGAPDSTPITGYRGNAGKIDS